MKRNTEFIECKFQTIYRRQVFGTDFDNVVHRFGYFTLGAESIWMETNT